MNIDICLGLGLFRDQMAPQNLLEDFNLEAPPPTCTYTHNIRYAYISWPDIQKPCWTHTLSPTGSLPFWFTVEILPPIITIYGPCTLTNFFYRFNHKDFTVSQYHPQTLKMKMYQNLLPPLSLMGVTVRLITMCLHKAGSPYNSNIHVPIHTKFVTHRGCRPEYVYASIVSYLSGENMIFPGHYVSLQ